MKIVPAFAAGIFSASAYPLGKPTLVLLEIGSAALWLATLRWKDYHQFSKSPIRGGLIQVLLLLCGHHLTVSQDLRNHPRWYGKYLAADRFIEARVADEVQLHTKTYRTRLSVTCIVSKTQKIPVKGELLAYFPRKLSYPPAYGQLLLLATLPQPIPYSGNPGAFEFRKYAARKNLHDQVYLTPETFLVLDSSATTDLYGTVLRARIQIVNILQQYIPSRRESGLAEALLIGYKENLDSALTQVYSNTGVIHIIAISGLHLGLIYSLLAYALGFLPKHRNGQLIKLCITLTGLWAFSILAGAGPSVIRSAVMFSCLGIGQYSSRRQSSINLLWASAFLLLAYHPFWLLDTGFQLSYAAVLGILLLQRPLGKLVYANNRILGQLIQLCTVTLAAQALTLPLTLYYFKQIPVYFLLANLVAVPLSSVILIGEILLCALSVWPVAARVLGTLIQKAIAVMNAVMGWMDQWPGALWSPLQVSPLQILILYMMVLMVVGSIYYPLKNQWKAILLLAAIFLSTRSFDMGKHRYQQVIVCYSFKTGTAVDVFEGLRAYCIRDTGRLPAKAYESQTRTCQLLYRIRTAQLLGWDGTQNRLLRYRNLLLLHLGENTALLPDRDLKKLPAIVCLESRSRVSLKSLAARMDVRQVVLMGSWPRKSLQRRQAEATALGIAVHSVVEKGAFVMNLH